MKMRISPGSLWVVYAMSDPKLVENMIPPSLEISPAKIYEDDVAPEPKLMFNLYDVNSRFVRGKRVDIQTLAVHRDTGKAHLVILDVLSTAHDWNPIDGIVRPNAVSDNPADDGLTHFSMSCDDGFIRVNAHDTFHKKTLDKRFAVEGNLMCFFKSHSVGYVMKFDEDEIMQPVNMMTSNITNSLWSSFRRGPPTHVLMHSHPMTFDVDLGLGVMSLW